MAQLKPTARVAVLVLHWNGVNLLQEFLPLWVQHIVEEGADLIIVDNGSTDSSVAYLRETYPDVPLIINPENLGFAEGYNRAIQQVEGYEYVLLLNSDAYLGSGWLSPMIKLMESTEQRVLAVQPKIRAYRSPQSFEYAGAAGGYLDALGYPYCRGRLFEDVELDRRQYDDVRYDLSWASGAALLVRRSDYLAVGGLDASFFAHQEEIDLCLRLKRLGGCIAYAPEAVAYHIGGASLAQGSSRKLYLNFRNNLLMLAKNLNLAHLIALLLLRLPLDLIASLRFLVGGSAENAWAVGRAWADFCAHVRRARAQYHALPPHQTKAKPSPLLKPIAILYHYYIRGRKTYSALPKH